MLEMQLIGNLGKDPEAHYAAEGALMVSFPVAATRRWTDRDGQKHEETTWVDVTVWGGLAEVCHQHLSKGRQVFVRGRPEVRAFKRKDGEAGAALRVTADEVIFLGGKPGEKAAQVEAAGEDEVPF